MMSSFAALGRPTLPLYQAKGAAAKKGGAAPAAAAAPEEKYDLSKQIPVNLLKEGGEPEYKADSEYPAWVFRLLDEKPLLEDMLMKGLENVPADKAKLVLRGINKRKIKDRNKDSAKD